MIRRLIAMITVLAGFVTVPYTASAHPHVWVTIRSELLYALDGAATGVRHTWTFDDMFSAFATTGLQKTGGTFTREALQPLAKVNSTLSRSMATSPSPRSTGGGKRTRSALPSTIGPSMIRKRRS